MYLMGLSRPILSPENALFQSSPFFVKYKKSKFWFHQNSVSDLKCEILMRINLKINLVWFDLKIFQHEGGYRMAKIAFSRLKINLDRPKYDLINIFGFKWSRYKLLKSKINIMYLVGLSRSIFYLENGVFQSSPILWSQILDLKNQKFWLLTKSQLQTWNLRFWWESTWKKFTVIFGVTDLKNFHPEGGVRMAKIAFLMVILHLHSSLYPFIFFFI